MQPVVGLEDLVGELREAHPDIRANPSLDGLLQEHCAHAEVAADVAHELYGVHVSVPVLVVYYPVLIINSS